MAQAASAAAGVDLQATQFAFSLALAFTILPAQKRLRPLIDERSLRLVPPLSSKKVPELIKEGFSNHSLDVHRTYTNGFLLSGQFFFPERRALEVGDRALVGKAVGVRIAAGAGRGDGARAQRADTRGEMCHLCARR